MKMNYFTFGTNNMPEAVNFYDTLFEGEEVTKIHHENRMTLWAGKNFMFALSKPANGEAATEGNGAMIGFQLNSADEVVSLYTRALNLGAKDAGKPTTRLGHFTAYFKDLDNNKICLSKHLITDF